MTDTADQGARSTPTHEDSPYISKGQAWRPEVGAHVMFEVDGMLPWEGVVTATAGALSNYNLAGMRMTRNPGGPNAADFALLNVLGSLLGTVTLASGHIEVEMKRILLTAKGEPEAGFADVDMMSKGLEDELGKVANRQDTQLATDLKPVLDWAVENKIRSRRNDAIHSAWALYEVGHLEASRLAPKSDGVTMIDNGEGLVDLATILWEYLQRLQKIVRWPTLVLPPLAVDTPVRELSFKLSAKPN